MILIMMIYSIRQKSKLISKNNNASLFMSFIARTTTIHLSSSLHLIDMRITISTYHPSMFILKRVGRQKKQQNMYDSCICVSYDLIMSFINSTLELYSVSLFLFRCSDDDDDDDKSFANVPTS